MYRIAGFRNQENQQMHEPSGYSWDPGVRAAKTSEDRYMRPNSSSSQSTLDEQITSPRSNVYNSSAIQQSTGKSEHNRVFILGIFSFL